MKSISENVFIEDSFSGVCLGAIRLEEGMVFIDSPLQGKDAQVWRSSLTKTGSGTDRLLVLLDEHLDRCSGAKAMKCSLITHERTAQVLGSRPVSGKPIPAKTGALWETVEDLGNIHSILPEITYTNSMQIHWGQETVTLEYHPGPARGATWVLLPTQKICFVGDCVLGKQPPFLASADLPTWLENLALLKSAKFRDYILISSRGGVITQEEVKQQTSFLKHVQTSLEKIAQTKADPALTGNLVPDLMKEFTPRNRKEEDLFMNRLAWGVQQLYTNHFFTTGKSSGR